MQIHKNYGGSECAGERFRTPGQVVAPSDKHRPQPRLKVEARTAPPGSAAEASPMTGFSGRHPDEFLFYVEDASE
jgi:hypothetical protein